MKSSLQSISPQELLSLLDSQDYVGAVSATDKYEGQVFSEEQLGKLLDRSDLAWTTIVFVPEGSPRDTDLSRSPDC